MVPEALSSLQYVFSVIASINISTTYGYDHIGLEVEDIHAACDDLTQRGYQFSMPPTDAAGLAIAFFKGPENITIELVQT